MNKKAKTVSLLLNVAIMFATVFALITITYSWYTRNSTTNISTISMSVSEFEGILLSGNGLNWSPTLTTGGGTGSIIINENVSLTSISTSAVINDGNMQFFTGEFSENAFNTILITNPNLYYVFDIYVMNNGDYDKVLALGKNSSVVSVNNKGVELSIRSAFINLGYANNMLDAIEIDGTGVSSVDYIWEANSTIRHNKIGLYQASYVPEGKVRYNGVNLEATGLTLVNNLVVDNIDTPEQEVVEVITYDPIGAGENSDITVLASNAISKLRIYIWCEGQDIDCVNSISGGTADLSFSFASYDVQIIDEEYIPVEKYSAPIIINSEGATYIWEETSTNITPERYSNEYVVKISKYISSQLITIRTIYTTQNIINIDNLASLDLGSYYIEVKVYSQNYCNSDYSNVLTFTVLNKPSNFTILTSIISWNSVSNAESYTIRVYDSSTQTTYLANTTLLSLNLATTMFNDSIYLPTEKQYTVSVKANGSLGYANSEYTDTLNWLYQ